MSTKQLNPPRFKVGDWVSFRYGVRQVSAQIIEDRGKIGINGRRLHRIRMCDESTEERSFEVPEVDLAPVEFNRALVMEYLKNEGLLEILRANLGDRKKQPRVWLAFDSDGNLIHTFTEEQGYIGGETVPWFALQGNQVFSPKSKEVVNFLTSFGLSPEEAEQVVKKVGTSP